MGVIVVLPGEVTLEYVTVTLPDCTLTLVPVFVETDAGGLSGVASNLSRYSLDATKALMVSELLILTLATVSLRASSPG
jgi:hypothetical protein